ncbi:translation initiation factor IF-2 [Pediococcus ethanolidurans]|uniref:translation initiation factor IF-2 n=1 Tax=Pediococcus ethanolidurans TaxID=319653 RepID=UPI001C1EB1C8|nr:translation initiation factor IF-2 [Pediococcus ethanolidurans]MBU7555072.1 translation initiation factor IF-2 [Pediococcus ethanolidurans]MBU7563280.1 translation initiation factor IF-2 [Pediococcus ethanolidurans]MCV3321685.1 translation initiation factor IF-2 [Pediococcus ethanolidurans]MCV3324550.1 translation initiation factor IF-2 [Pediococcus ethanolidurans]MCV3555818.1 translation initiation factor IF-2 [Pediococcus ethanolidurans]
MGKKRIYELAKEINVSSKDIIAKAKESGFDVKNHMSTLGENEERQIRQSFATKNNQKSETPKKKPTLYRSAKTGKTVVERTAGKKQETSVQRKSTQTTQKTQGTKPVNNNHKPTAQTHTTGQTNSNSNRSQRSGQNTSTSRNQNHSTQNQTRNNTRSAQNNAQNHSSQKSRTSQNNSSNGGNRSTSSNRTNTNTTSRQNNSTQNSSTSRDGRRNNSQGNRNSSFGRNNNRYNNRNRYNKKSKKNGRLRQVSNKPAPTRKSKPLPEVFEYNDGTNVAEIAKKIHREPAEIIKKLFMLGVMVNQNQTLDKDTIEILAADYGIKAEEKQEVNVSDIDKMFEEEAKNTDHLESRPPVVTIMGHVDHGKTTLLDKLRHSHITAGEAGGITQAIGAYQLKHDGKLITFLDTPGHAAFTEMRARGADITDITILVVAADDGVMPQTIEAINHAKAANVPIIVAVNKIDKPGANPKHVMEQLTEYGLVSEDWGGDTIFVEISAKFGKNLDELLDMILLQAEVMELKANPDQNGAGSVIEASLDPGKGSIATVLVQQGTMRVGDPIVVGSTFGRVRTMTNELGRRVKEATPSTPVEITGLNDVPEAGDRFVIFDDEKSARAAGEERAKEALMEERRANNHVTLDNLFDSLKEGEMKEVDLIIKADVQGSVEALSGSLKKIDVKGVRVNIIHTAVGAINESDVALAEASNAIIIGFNVRPTNQAKQLADSSNVDIRLHRVIYNAIDEVESAMKGMLEPTYKEEITGQVEVRQIYKVSHVGTVVGGYVTEGYIQKDSGVRLIRDSVVIYEGKLASLKRFKDDVKQVKQGYELGLTIDGYNDIKVDDVIEAYIMKEVPVE